LKSWDAVVCVETVEHLDPGPLGDLPEAIFGAFEPKMVIITTPNIEFNVVWGMSGKELR